jgi:hypothetical protein
MEATFTDDPHWWVGLGAEDDLITSHHYSSSIVPSNKYTLQYYILCIVCLLIYFAPTNVSCQTVLGRPPPDRIPHNSYLAESPSSPLQSSAEPKLGPNHKVIIHNVVYLEYVVCAYIPPPKRNSSQKQTSPKLQSCTMTPFHACSTRSILVQCASGTVKWDGSSWMDHRFYRRWTGPIMDNGVCLD